MTAEGGTFYEHAVTLARSKHIDGPYETMPGNPLLTAYNQQTDGLQRAGHASLVQTANDEWYLAHLCGRPLERSGPNAAQNTPANGYQNLHCNLGRETALQLLRWRDDDWPEIDAGPQQAKNTPRVHVPAPALPASPWPAEPERDDFDSPTLSPHLNSLRVPVDVRWLSLTERASHLRLRGRESLMSLFAQSLVARRQQHFHCHVQTKVDFEPEHFQQMAGLVAYYNTSNHAYLHISAHPDTGARVLRLSVNRDGALSEPVQPVPLAAGAVEMRVEFRHASYQFSYCEAGGTWRDFGPALDTAMLSDEAATHIEGGFARSFGFTGNFIGIACQDLAGTRRAADFDYFDYAGHD
jgi:xylan 1,4-beta-xylosidase